LAIVNENREKFEPFGSLVEESLIHFTSQSRTTDSFAEQENDDLQENLVEDDLDSEDENIVDFFDAVNRWARQIVQSRSSDNFVKIPSLRLLQEREKAF
jgi:hypothetical protein